MDWRAWHRDYDDPASSLSGRRRAVQREITRWLDSRDEALLRVVSACSGDGRDLLDVWCGVFGNLSDEDVSSTIDVTASLCAPGAEVLWTRGRFADRDQVEPTLAIRRMFAERGFAEVSLEIPDEAPYRVGAHRYDGVPAPLEAGHRFFTFRR